MDLNEVIERFFYNKNDDGAPREHHQMLFVALYLVLLAFFIMLNSITYVDETRTNSALKSINRSFAKDTDKTAPDFKLLIPLSAEILTQRFFKNMGKLAQTKLQVKEVDVIKDGNTMHVTINSDEFFYENSPNMRSKHNAFLDTIAENVTQELHGIAISLYVTISSKEYLVEDVDMAETLEIARLHKMISNLKKRNIPSTQIVLGTTQHEKPFIKFSFELERTKN